jgi:hypothetical protein
MFFFFFLFFLSFCLTDSRWKYTSEQNMFTSSSSSSSSSYQISAGNSHMEQIPGGIHI